MFFKENIMRKFAGILLALLLILSQSSAAFGAETLEEQIAALPDVEEFKAMSREEQVDVYNRAQYAYEAYMALPTAEEKDALEGAEEKFDALFSHFNTLIMPVEPPEETGKVSNNQVVWVVLIAMALILLGPVIKPKH